MFQAPQMSDYPDTAEGQQAYYADADRFYAWQLDMRGWADVAAGDELNAYADSLAA